MKSKNRGAIAATTAALLVGLGAGNMTAIPDEPKQLEPISMPAPEPERVEVPVRFEELHHKADKSLRSAFDLPDATNADIVAVVAAKDEQIEKLRDLNKQAAEVIKQQSGNIARAQSEIEALKSAVSAAQQYRSQKLEGRR